MNNFIKINDDSIRVKKISIVSYEEYDKDTHLYMNVEGAKTVITLITSLCFASTLSIEEWDEIFSDKPKPLHTRGAR